MHPSNALLLITCIASVLLSIPVDLEAAPGKRSFRAIVPIKQSVPPGKTGMKIESVSVKIPPPPVPRVRSSLFPEGSVSDADPPPETIEAPAEEEETKEIGNRKEENKPEKTSLETSPQDIAGPTLQRLREEAHRLADMGLKYKFGEEDPDKGGLDCSSTMQYLLTKIGIEGVPRTSYNQYYWLKKKKLVRDLPGRNAARKLYEKLSPGDLLFWGGTWKSGHKVSHVMIYMGYDPDAEKHYVFGARGRSSKGLLGNGVDIFELDPNRGRLVAHGKIPGLIYPE